MKARKIPATRWKASESYYEHHDEIFLLALLKWENIVEDIAFPHTTSAEKFIIFLRSLLKKTFFPPSNALS
jgi:hypothetical protein